MPTASVLPGDSYPDEMEVRALGPRVRCTKCGRLGAEVRTVWSSKD